MCGGSDYVGVGPGNVPSSAGNDPNITNIWINPSPCVPAPNYRCPWCGRCPHCGQPFPAVYPYYLYPYQPYYPPDITYTQCGTTTPIQCF